MAILLIVNSHLERFYPISALSFGGHLGNSIFYLISGYGLSLSHQRNPLPILKWIEKRLIMILIPFVGILMILNIGNMDGFLKEIFNNLIWHKSEQLQYFLPVLWALYIFFRPLCSLRNEYLLAFILFIWILSVIFFYFRINNGHYYGTSLPSEWVFFPLNAIGCFAIGILLSRIDFEKITKSLSVTGLKLLAIFLIFQFLHKVIIIYFPDYVWINFYFNFICVVAVFLLIISANFSMSKEIITVIKGISTSSLAIYIVHFRIIGLASYLQLEFPFSVLFVFLHSFLWAYTVSYFFNILTARIMTLRTRNT